MKKFFRILVVLVITLNIFALGALFKRWSVRRELAECPRTVCYLNSIGLIVEARKGTTFRVSDPDEN